MAKPPAFQFYTGDWLKDPALSICSPATRGVWIDLICAMHESDRSGRLCGTHEQLARVARCSTVELAQALTDIQTTGAADVTERNGVVTVTNRRMYREHSERLATKTRVRKHRRNAETDQDVTSHSSSSSSSSDPPNPPPAGGVSVGNFVRGWITANCPEFLRSGLRPFERLIKVLGKDEAVRRVQAAMAKRDVGNPFAYLEAIMTKQAAAKALAEASGDNGYGPPTEQNVVKHDF